jgi:threonine synthase
LADCQALPPNLWRYRAALPIPPEAIPVSLGEGFTPLQTLTVEGVPVQIKLDYLFPSGSYKDRGATLLMTMARYWGIDEVVQDSSGNAGCAIAQYAALANIGCRILVPEDTAAAKLVQMEAYKAQVTKVKGNREATAQAAYQMAQHTFYASHVWNPFFLHGTKTFAYEIFEQRNGQMGEAWVLPAGNGTLLLGAYIGLLEMQAMGWITRLPKLIGVQAELCQPLAEAWTQGKAQQDAGYHSHQATWAEGIAIAQPQRGFQMLEAIRQTGGAMIAVAEADIADALLELTQQGYYVEPTSAAVFAGLKQYLRQQPATNQNQVVSVLTGSGLKTTEKIDKILQQQKSPA